MSTRQVLITGGSGLIGRALADNLRSSYETIIFDRKPPKGWRGAFIEGDIKSLTDVERALDGVEVVVHLAALPIDTGDPVEMMEINVMGTFHVMEAAARHHVQRVVYVSSTATMGYAFQKKTLTPDYVPLDEKHPCRPADMYSLTKYLGEKICLSYGRMYNLSVICLRPVTVLPHVDQDPSLPRTIEKKFGKGHLVRTLWGYTDLRDVVQAFRLSIKAGDIPNGAYNISAADMLSIEGDALTLLRKYYPAVKQVLNMDNFLVKGDRSFSDLTKSRQILGYRPRFSFRGRTNQDNRDLEETR